uniref:G-protein coupled receptors family 1 profile domain-containing protein n=1 Tax=Trichobilharzia regenti TaxID=157069 RepID=A0AA85KE21_TRIRE|nr:unnamed protein product [Trichobilharzia regenti]
MTSFLLSEKVKHSISDSTDFSNYNNKSFSSDILDGKNFTVYALPGYYNIWKSILLGIILTFLRERYMRKNLTNWFLVSLAIADLLVGTIVMPFAIFHTLNDEYWPFGREWCDGWHAFDVLSSTASILNLCAIALERFWATENPITHTSMRTRRHCLLMLAFVWICSILISFPAILWWRNTQDYIASSSYICQFTSDSIYLIVSSCVSFYIPLIVMLIVYARIYQTASNLMKSLKSGEKIVVYSHPKFNSPPNFKFLTNNSSNEQKKKSWFKTSKNKIKPNEFMPSHFSMSQGDTMVLRIHRGGKVDTINSNINNNSHNNNDNNKLKTHKLKAYSNRNHYFDKNKIKQKKTGNAIKFTNSVCLNDKRKINTMSNTNTRINMTTRTPITNSVLSNSALPPLGKRSKTDMKIVKPKWKHTYSLTQISTHSQIFSDGLNSGKVINYQMKSELNFRRSHSSGILNYLSQSHPVMQCFKRHQHQSNKYHLII